jgi:hypothetical protein
MKYIIIFAIIIVIIILFLFFKYFSLERFLDGQYKISKKEGDLILNVIFKFYLDKGANTSPTKKYPKPNGSVLISNIVLIEGKTKYMSGDKFPVTIWFAGLFSPIIILDPLRSDYGGINKYTDEHFVYHFSKLFDFTLTQYQLSLDTENQWKTFPGKKQTSVSLSSSNYDLSKITVYNYMETLKKIKDNKGKVVANVVPAISQYIA